MANEDTPSRSGRWKVKALQPDPPAPAPEPVAAEPPPPGPILATALLRSFEPISVLFLACLVGGAGVALLGLRPEKTMQQIGFWGPIGATLAYPLVGILLKFHQRPQLREQLADNSYYLGFIFTQFALVLGFLPPVLFGSDIGPEDVLHYFGVAIGASMIGLVARTLFVQTGQTLSGYNERNEREVEALAREVSERSRAVLGQFDLLAREVRQAREQSATAFAENTTTISRIMAAGADQIAEVQRRIVDDIAQARSAFRSGLDADSAGHADLFRKHSDALGAQFEAHAQAALQRARGAVDDFEASARTAVEQREQMAFTVSKDLAIALEAIHGHTEAVGEQTDAFREGARAVGQAANEVVQRSLAAQSNLVSSVEEAAARLRQTLGSLPGQLAAVNEAVGATTQALETGATALEAFSRLAPTVDALGGQVASVTAKVDAAAQTLEAGAQSMRDTVGEVRSNAEREAETLRADLDQSVAALRTTLDSFRTALSQIRV